MINDRALFKRRVIARILSIMWAYYSNRETADMHFMALPMEIPWLYDVSVRKGVQIGKFYNTKISNV